MRRSKGGGSMTGLGWTIPVLLVQLLLPVAAAMTGALHSWPVTGVICILAAAAGWAVLPQEANPSTLARAGFADRCSCKGCMRL